jgi:hypothetical protein
VVSATPFTVARKDSDPPSGTVAVEGTMATDTEGEAEGVTDVEEFPHPVGRTSRPGERANTIPENQRCFCRFDFIARSPDKLGYLHSHLHWIS